MQIKKSDVIVGIRYIERILQDDLKNTRLVTYSWSRLMDSGIVDVHERIYRERIPQKNQLYGLFHYPDNAFLVRGLSGGVRVYAVDLRDEEDSGTRHLSYDPNNGNQIYIPAGVAWGVLTLEEGSAIQIHTTGSFNMRDPEHWLDPFDKKVGSPFEREAEFSIADLCGNGGVTASQVN